MTNDEAVERIKTRIDEICRQRFIDKPAMLLSELGIALGADLGLLKLETGRKLTEFIGEQFSGKYRIARLSARSNAIVIMPAATSDEQVAGINVEDIKPPRERGEAIPRFRSIFWTAFAKPVQEGRRFLRIDPLHFEDSLKDPPAGEDWYEIPSSAIPSEGLLGRDVAIYENIKKWLEDNRLTADPFIVESGADSQSRKISLLYAMISTLDAEQQKEIKLPLDVVRKLLGRTVSW